MSRVSSIILDNVLEESSVDKINDVLNNSTAKVTWYDLDEDHILTPTTTIKFLMTFHI